MRYRPFLDDDNEPLEYQPDPLGRVDQGRWASKALRDGFGRIEPDEQLEAFRDAWRSGATYRELFGDGALQLKGRVADDGENRRSDVAKIETLLNRVGLYDLDFTDGPTGLYSSILGGSLKNFQTAAGLEVDGIVNPDGETHRSLTSGLTPDASAKRVNSGSQREVAETNRRAPDGARVVSADNRDGEERGGYRPSFLPARFLTPEAQQEFEQKSGLKLRKTANGFELVNPATGEPFAQMPRELAAELARDWTWFSDRVWLLSAVARQDLTRNEKRAVVDRLLPAADPEKFGIDKSLPGFARRVAKQRFQEEHRRVEALRRTLYDGVDALEQEATRDEVLPRLRQNLLPELYSEGRQLREILLDLVPVLGNARSYVHFQNELAAAREKIEAGDWSGAAESGGLAFLNAVGMYPGANIAKLAGKVALKVVPYGEATAAAVKLGRMEKRWDDLSEPINASKIFGKHYDNLPDHLKDRLNRVANWSQGGAGQEFAFHLGKQVDPLATQPGALKLPIGRRTHDMVKRDFHEVVLDDIRHAFAKFRGNPAPSPTQGIHHEVKTGAGPLKSNQRAFDDLVNNNPSIAASLGVRRIRALRVLPSEIPPQFVIDHSRSHLARLVTAGKLPQADADALMKGVNDHLRSRTATVRTLDYVAFLSHLAATGERNAIDPAFNR